MTARRAAQSVATQPIPVAVVRYFRAQFRTVARCNHCGWMQRAATLAEARIHVRHHPTHLVRMERIEVTEVWAETRSGEVLTEDRHA